MKKIGLLAFVSVFMLAAILGMQSRVPDDYAASPQEKFWKIAISVSAPAGSPLEAGTPTIIKLGSLADAMPAEVDPFGEKTGEEGDDADWAATYLFLGNTRMPHQVDDVDGVPGFSDGDELVFQTPSTIAAGSSETFSLYFTTKDVELPAPQYPLTCTISPYPLKDYLNEVFGPGIPNNTIGESYVMENGNISAAVLVEGAWMSSCLYQLIVNETGFDIVKQNLEVEIQTEPYKWTRFVMPADIGWLENNPNPTSGVFERLFIKPGPVRSIIKMRSTASYDRITGIYALVTYTMYANQSWLDYQLDITGPEVTSGMTLDVNLMNREWAGVAGTIYDTVYIPGREDLSRLERFDVTADQITDGWYIIYGETEAKGFGMSFDIEGLNMIAWSKITEGVSILYGNPTSRISVDCWYGPTMDDIGMEFPFHARYYPIDPSITTLTPAEYMSAMYAGWLVKPEITIQTAEETTSPLPFTRIFNAGTWDETTYYVKTFSNSTVSGFNFNPDEKLISFNVTGLSGTAGFCNVTIPRDLLWGVYTVYVGDTEVDYTQTDNSTHAFLYFTYNHISHNVRIYGTEAIPEFPTWTSMLLILMMLTVAIATYKRTTIRC